MLVEDENCVEGEPKKEKNVAEKNVAEKPVGKQKDVKNKRVANRPFYYLFLVLSPVSCLSHMID